MNFWAEVWQGYKRGILDAFLTVALGALAMETVSPDGAHSTVAIVVGVICIAPFAFLHVMDDEKD